MGGSGLVEVRLVLRQPAFGCPAESDGGNEGSGDEAARANKKGEVVAVYEGVDGGVVIFSAEGVGCRAEPTSTDTPLLPHRDADERRHCGSPSVSVGSASGGRADRWPPAR